MSTAFEIGINSKENISNMKPHAEPKILIKAYFAVDL